MGLLTSIGRRLARNPGRIIDIETEMRMPLRGWEAFKDEASAGPMAMGASGLLARADNTGLDMGLLGAGGAAGVVGATQLAREDQEAEDVRDRMATRRDMLEALQRLRARQAWEARLMQAREDGYMGGLEAEHEALRRQISGMNDSVYQEDRFMRNRGY